MLSRVDTLKDTCLDEIKGQRKKAAIAIDPTLAAQAGVKVGRSLFKTWDFF
jgi:hypothetical protein